MADFNTETKDISKIGAEKPVYIFGKDIREIKCFRKSFIYGICLGVFGGLTAFLFTSKALYSTNVAFASTWVGVFGYWFPCRYKYETSILVMEAIKKEQLKLLEKKSNQDDS